MNENANYLIHEITLFSYAINLDDQNILQRCSSASAFARMKQFVYVCQHLCVLSVPYLQVNLETVCLRKMSNLLVVCSDPPAQPHLANFLAWWSGTGMVR